jgi:hypothetical protein
MSNKSDYLSIIHQHLSNASDQEMAEFIEDITNDLSVRNSYINGFLDNPQEYLTYVEHKDSEIQNGPIAGILVSGIFTSFSSGLLMGAIAVAAGLIQYWLRDKDPQKDPKFVPVFEGSANGDIAKFGEVIPAIFTSVRDDSTGGVQTNGKLIHSLVDTTNGTQTLYIRYAISHGTIKQIDLSKTLINDQPLSNFDPSYYDLTYLNGTQSQVVRSEFNYHSQNFSPANNNNVGCRLIDADANVTGNLSRILVSEEEYTLYEGGQNYQFFSNGNTTNPIEFKITGKNITGTSPNFTYNIYTNVPVTAGSNNKVFKIQSALYRSTKRVTELHLNFNCNIYGRNDKSELIDFAQLYKIEIKQYSSTNWAELGFIYIYSKNPTRILRSLIIKGLTLNVYDIKISPMPYATTNADTWEIWDAGNKNTYSRSLSNGISCQVQMQGYQTPNSVSILNGNIDQSKGRVPDNGSQHGWSLNLRSVNELEPSINANQVNLPGICTCEAIIRLNEVINGQINLTFFVKEGIMIPKPIYTGDAESGSSSSQLKFTPGVDPSITASILRVRNLDKRLDSTVSSISANRQLINTTTPIDLEFGDRWLIYYVDSSCWWPEIYASFMYFDYFGIAKQVIGDYYLDWESIITSRFWCEQNEHGVKFAWHGILSQQQDLSTVNAENSRKVMLQPWRGNGQTGFYPQMTPPTSALYNSANSANLRLEYTTNDRNPINTLTVVYLKQEHEFNQGGVKFQPQSITAQTHQARLGIAPEVSQSVELRNCTSETQAIKSAQILLNIARYSARVLANFEAKTIESLSLKLGNNFRLQTSSTIYNREQSGVIVEMGPVNNSFRLDREFTLINSLCTSNNATSFFDGNIDFIAAGVEVGDIVRDRETGITSIITGFNANNWIVCNPPIPQDHYYEIADLTVSSLLVTIARGDYTAIPQQYVTQYIGGHIWYTLFNPTAVYPTVGDVVGIGSVVNRDRLFQSIAIEVKSPDARDSHVSEMGVSISGTNWDYRQFNYSDVTVITRDQVINEA